MKRKISGSTMHQDFVEENGGWALVCTLTIVVLEHWFSGRSLSVLVTSSVDQIALLRGHSCSERSFLVIAGNSFPCY